MAYRVGSVRFEAVLFTVTAMCVTFANAISASAQSNSSSLPSAATASSPASTSKGSASEALKNKQMSEPEGIIDPKIRAESGSLSKYSAKFNFSFGGPAVGDLANENLPNPDGSIGSNKTYIGGSVSARYKFDSKNSLNAGTGINGLTPFQGIQRTDLRTPFMSYDHTSKIGGWQTRQSIGASLTTTPEYRDVGQVAGGNYDFSWFHQIAGSRVSAGLDSSLGYFFYGREYRPAVGKSKGDSTAGRYNWGFFPALKFKATDKLSIYTSYNITVYNARSQSNFVDLWQRTQSQRLGLEYAFTKDIYFAPYLNFYPKSFNWSSTTVNFNTIFSIL